LPMDIDRTNVNIRCGASLSLYLSFFLSFFLPLFLSFLMFACRLHQFSWRRFPRRLTG
jgi:hypothetical protein